MNPSDRAWEDWGQRDPYFGVLTDARYRMSAMNDAARSEFFRTGRLHVDAVLARCRREVGPSFRPASVLDFGCGVGRTLIPFAEHATRAVGIDVSPSMIEHARANCAAAGRGDVELVCAPDARAVAGQRFDLVHSHIVLQHIDPERGRAIFADLVGCVAPGGAGALHVTFADTAYEFDYGRPPRRVPDAGPPPSAGTLGRLRSVLAGAPAAVEPQRAPAPDGDPAMPMHFYEFSDLMFLLQRSGIGAFRAELTDHGGALGVFVFFSRAA